MQGARPAEIRALSFMEQEKQCTKCGVTKPLSQFHRTIRKLDGHHSQCKVCDSVASKDYRTRHHEAVLERARKWRQENPGASTRITVKEGDLFRTCKTCNGRFPKTLEHFRKQGGYFTRDCRPCWAAKRPNRKERARRRAEAGLSPRPANEFQTARNNRVRELREQVNALKVATGCVSCGYTAHPQALEYDHLPGFDKIANISDLTQKAGWAEIEAEIKKCELVCANCHRIRHYERRSLKLSS